MLCRVRVRVQDGYSGPECSTTDDACPNRCYGHGECVAGVCHCREGFTGSDCSEIVKWEYGSVLSYSLQGFMPVAFIALLFLFTFLGFCCFGYSFNRWRGATGTAAIPLWDYYAKRMRNAPLFEPIFAVSAATQTTAVP